MVFKVFNNIFLIAIDIDKLFVNNKLSELGLVIKSFIVILKLLNKFGLKLRTSQYFWYNERILNVPLVTLPFSFDNTTTSNRKTPSRLLRPSRIS
jgi:hypothetical protein